MSPLECSLRPLPRVIGSLPFIRVIVYIRHRRTVGPIPPIIWFYNFILPCLRCRFYTFLLSHFKKMSPLFALERPSVPIFTKNPPNGASWATCCLPLLMFYYLKC
jgi:hypothetical protein